MSMPNSGATNGWHPSGTIGENVTLERDFENIKVENVHYKKRCEQLEQLCLTLFERYDPWDYQTNDDVISYDEAYDRMDALGLLEGESHE